MRIPGFSLALSGAALLAAAAPALAQCGLTFAPAQQHGAGGGQTQQVAIGDLNGDTWPDLVLANNSGGAVAILLGTGGGAYATPITVSASVGPLRSVALADVNNDTRLDIIALGTGGPQTIAVLRGNGNGTFQSPLAFAAGATPMFIVAADFNGDGNTDLAVANNVSNDVSVLRGNGDGTFQAAVNHAVGGGPRWLAVGRFNADALPDLIVANQNSGNVSVLLGSPGGAFQAAINTSAGVTPRSVAAGDLNGDGLDDAVVGANSGGLVSVLICTGGGGFQPAVLYGVNGGPSGVAVGDIDLDGRPDVVSANFGTSTVSIRLGIGDGTLQPMTNLSGASSPNAVAIGNIDHAPGSDLVVANNSGGQVTILLNQAVPVSITQQPTPCQVVQSGDPLTLTAAATGPGLLGYHWRRNGVDMSDGGSVYGTTTNTLIIASTACGDSALYDVVISSNCPGVSATSAAAVVAVTGANPCAGAAPAFIQHPASQAVLSGSSVSFTVALFPGLPPTYQWRMNGLNLVNGAGISGVTTPTLTINPTALADNGSAFDCVAGNACGAARSNPAGLAVAPRCPADLNGDHATTPADIALYVNEFFAELSSGCN